MLHKNTTRSRTLLSRRLSLIVWAVACGVSVPTKADSIVVKGVSRNAIRFTGLANGYLVFRTAAGASQSARIDTLDLIVVERGAAFADFNQAERLVAGGEPAKAISRYQRMVHMSESFWSDLLYARLSRATDRAGQLDRATGYFIRVAQGAFSGPATAVWLMPESIPDRRDGKTARAITQLLAVSSQLQAGPVRSLLTIYRYELLRRVGDRRAVPFASRVAATTVDDSIGTDRVYGIVLIALRSVLSHDTTPDQFTNLDRAIRYAPDALLPDFLLLKGDALLSTAKTREDLIRASWPYLRVVAHMPDDPRAATGLVGAATALERMKSFPQAAALLTECSARRDVDDTTRDRAEAALARVQTRDAP